MKNKIREARFKQRMPQILLQLRSGVHQSTISRIECGYIQPSEEQRKKLAKALKTPEKEVFPG